VGPLSTGDKCMPGTDRLDARATTSGTVRVRPMTVVVFGGESRVWLGPFCLVGVAGGFGHPELAGIGEVVGHLPQFDVQLLR
jgi:hypothetical protein